MKKKSRLYIIRLILCKVLMLWLLSNVSSNRELVAQELLDKAAASNELSVEAELDPTELVVVPILYALPTITSVIASGIKKTIQLQADKNIQTNIVLGEIVSLEEVQSLLPKYLLDYDYDMVLFVLASSTDTEALGDSTIDDIEIQDIEGLEGSNDLVSNFSVDMHLYSKGITKPVHIQSYDSNLTTLKTTILDTQHEREIEEYAPLINSVASYSKERFYFTIHINAEQESRPEYILKIQKEHVLFSDYEKGIAYLPLEKQRIYVYQMDNGKEVLVKTFTVNPESEHNEQKSVFIEVGFFDASNPWRLADYPISVGLMTSYGFPLYSNFTSIFYPSLLLSQSVAYHYKQYYAGGKAQWTVVSALNNGTNAVISNRYGIFIDAGVAFDFAQYYEWHAGLNLGALFLAITSAEEYGFVAETALPAFGINFGVSMYVPVRRKGSIRIVGEIEGLSASYVVREQDPAIIANYLAGRVSMGVGWRF